MDIKSWTNEHKREIIGQRGKDALTYSRRMRLLSLNAQSMPEMLTSRHCSMQVRIVETSDDTVTSHKSALWLKERSDNASITTTYGGHLAIVAEPERLAAILYGAEK